METKEEQINDRLFCLWLALSNDSLAPKLTFYERLCINQERARLYALMDGNIIEKLPISSELEDKISKILKY
jgi:hypothetical protein